MDYSKRISDGEKRLEQYRKSLRELEDTLNGKDTYDSKVAKEEYARLREKILDMTPEKARDFLLKKEKEHMECAKSAERDAMKAVSECEKIIKELQENPLIKKSGGSELIFLGLIPILIGIFFLSLNLTGNVIGNMTQTTSNWIGGVLFILGVVGSYVYFKK